MITRQLQIGVPMPLWVLWWNALQMLRPAFSRLRTFLWFATVVAGFTVVNDVSLREWQWRSPTMMMGKGFDTHGPTGPWIVTPDEIAEADEWAARITQPTGTRRTA